MNKLKRFLIVTAALIAAVVTAISVGIATNKAQAANPDSPSVTFKYDVYTKDDWDKMKYIESNLLAWLQKHPKYTEMNVTSTYENSEAGYYEFDLKDSSFLNKWKLTTKAGIRYDSSTSCYTYFDNKELYEILGVDKLSVHLVDNAAETGFDIADVGTAYTSIYDKTITEAPASGDKLVMSITATSDVAVNAIHISIDQTKLGLTAGTIGNSDFIDNGLKNAKVDSSDTANIYNNDGGDNTCFTMGWANKSTANSIAAGKTIPVGAVSFTVGTLPSSGFSVNYSSTASTNFRTGSTSYTSNVAPTHFDEDEINFSASSANVYKILDNVSFTATAPTSPVVNFTFTQGASDTSTVYGDVEIGSDTTALTMKVDYNTTKITNAVKVNGVAISGSGASTPVSFAVGAKITIDVQDNSGDTGNDTKRYEYTIKHISSDTSLSISVAGSTEGDSAGTPTIDATNKITFSGELKFKNTGYVITANPTASGAKVYKGNSSSTTLLSTGNNTINFTDNSYLAVTHNTQEITVEAPSGVKTTYTLVVKRAQASTDTSLSALDIKVNGTGGTKINSGSSDTLTTGTSSSKLVYISTNSIFVSATPTDTTNAKIYFDNAATAATTKSYSGWTSAGTVTINFEVRSEAYAKDTSQKATHSITVYREIASSASSFSYTLKNSSGSATETPVNSTPSTDKYKVDATNFNDNKFQIIVTGYDKDKSKVYVHNNTSVGTFVSPNGTDITATGVYTLGAIGTDIYVTCFAEDNSSKTTKLIQTEIKSTDSSLTNVQLNWPGASGNSETIAESAFTATGVANEKVATMTKTIPYSYNGSKIGTVTVIANGHATGQTITYDGTANQTINITDNGTNAVSQVVVIKVVSKDDSTAYTEYKLTINRAAPQTDVRLKELKFEDQSGNSLGSWNQTTQTFTPATTADLERTVASITCTAEFINDNVSLYDGATTAFSNTATRTYTRQQTFTNTTAVGSITFDLRAKDESGSFHNILTATFTRKAANDDISLNPTTSYLEYVDNDGNPHTIALDTTSFTIDSTYTNYTMKSGITIPYGVTSVTSVLYPNASTGAKPTKLNFTSSSTAYASVLDESGVAHPNPVTKSVIASSPTFHVFAYTELRNNVQVNIKVNIAAAKNDNAFTWDLINNSGVAETKPTPTGSEYNFNNLEETDYPTNKFKLNIALVNPANGGTIYVTTDDSNDAKIKGVSDANKYDPSKTYDIGVGKVYYIVCYAENNTTNKVTVKATFKGQNNNKMKNVLVWDETGSTPVAISFTFNPATPTQADIIVPFSVKKVRLEAVPDASTATLVSAAMGQAFALTNTGTPTSTPVGSPNVKKIQLQSETKVAGTEYTFNIYREDAAHDQYMETATINSTINLYSPNTTNVYDTYTKLDNVINVRLPRTASNTAVLDFTVSQKAKTFNVIGATNNGSNYSVTLTNGGVVTVKVQVQSEYNASESPSSYNEYTINIYKADDSVTIGSFALYDQNGNEAEDANGNVIYTYSSTDSYPKTITVPYSQTHGEMRLTLPTGSYVQHSGDSVLKQLTAGSTTPITVTVESEFHKLCADAPAAQQVDYIFNIKRNEGKSINTLKEITITIPNGGGSGVEKKETWYPDIDGDGTDDVASTTFQITNVDGGALNATISYVKADDSEKVTGDVGVKVLNLSAGSHTYTITVTSEKGDPHQYDIIVAKEVIVLSSVAKLADIVVTASDGKTYLASTLPSNPYTAENELYTVTLPATTTSYTVSITKLDPNTKVFTDQYRKTELTGTTIPKTVPEGTGRGEYVFLYTTSQDGSAQMNYKLTVNVEDLDPNRYLDDLRVDGSTVPGFNKDKKDYEVNVVNTVEHVTIEAFAQSTNATITYQDADGNVIADPTTAPGVTLVEGDNKFKVVCTAQNKEFYVYNVNIIRDHKSTMTSVVIHTGDPTNPIAEYTPGTNTLDPTDPASPGVVDYTVKEITVSGIPTGGNDVKVEVVVTDPEGNKTTKTLPQDGTDVKIPIEPGTSSVNIVVTPESGTPTSYPVNITRKPGSEENYILTYEHAGTNITPDLSKTKFTYDYIVPRNTATFNPTFTVSDNATYELPAQKAMHVGLNSFDVVVKSQTGNPQTYTFNVYAVEIEKDVLSVYGKETDAASAEIVDIDGTTKIAFPGDGNTSTINVDNSVSQFFLEINPKGSYAKVKVDGVDFVNSIKNVTEGTNTFNVEVISEYATYNPTATDTKTTFKIVVIRGEKDKEKRLDSLVISWAGGTPVIWDASQDDADNTDTDVTHVINVENVGSVTSVTIAATQTGNPVLSTMSGTGVKSLTTSASDYSINTQVIVTSQFGKKNIYDITITRGPANANDDNEIIDILVTDADGNTYIGEGKFDPETQEYNVNIPYTKTNQSYTISVKTNEGSPAIVTGAGQTQIVHPNYSKTHDVYATSKSGQKGTVYKVNVTAESPSNENRLASLTVDGVMVPGFEEDKLNYIISAVQPYTKTSVKIGATAKDPLAKITGALDDQVLEVGPNLYQVNVTAQDGTPKNYTITITRDSEAPVLANIDTDTGLTIKTPEGVDTVFSGKVYSYLYASVSTDVDEITLKALTTSTDHTVTCSPNKAPLTPAVKSSGMEYGFRVSLPNTGDTLNEFVLKVTDTNAKSSTYVVRVRRMDETGKSTELTKLTFKEHETGNYTSDINDHKIGDILDLKKDVYDGIDTQYVDNKVRNIDVDYTALIGATTYNDGTTVDVYNNTNLKVGDNYIVVKVTSPNKEVTRTILAHVYRAENAFDAEIEEIPAFKNDFADSNIKAKYTVPTDVTSLTYSVTNSDKTDNNQPTVKFTNADDLQVGENKVNLVITAADGTTEMHEFIVVRESSGLDIKINEVAAFNTDYANDDIKQTYKVPSTVGKLTFEVTDPVSKEKLTFIAKNADRLAVGENQVTLVATKSDGTTEVLTVTIEREKIKYEIDKNAYEYAVTEQAGKYSVKLDTVKPTEISDWKKYIKFDADQKLNVELLSDVDADTTEVLLKVSSEDGLDSEIVTLNLDRTQPKQTSNAFDFTDSSNLLMWIILLIAIILLVIILISVNRDKYGSVNKNRKKE